MVTRELRGIGRPTRRLRSLLSRVHQPGETVGAHQAMRDVETVEAMASLLRAAFRATRTTDGRIDTRDVAHHVMTRMGQLRRPNAPATMTAIIDDATAVTAFARLLTEAIERTQGRDGRLDMESVAGFVVRRMREHTR